MKRLALAVLLAGFASTSAFADIVELTVEGYIYDGYDYTASSQNRYLRGQSVEIVYKYRLGDAPSDSSQSPTYGYYYDNDDWIVASVSIGSNTVNEDDVLNDADPSNHQDWDSDYLSVVDGYYDYIRAYSRGQNRGYSSSSGYSSDYFDVRSYFYYRDLLSGDSAALNFNRSRVYSYNCYSCNYIRAYDTDSHSATDPNLYARYYATYASARHIAVSEPGSLALLGIGMIAIAGLYRRRRDPVAVA